MAATLTPLLAGKRCLLVGGTGGLGLECAAHFLQQGAQVALAGLPAPDGGDPAQDLAPHGPCRFFAVDAGRSTSVKELFHQAVAWMGGLDVLFHLAGASGRRHGDGPLHTCTDEGWDWTIQTNLTNVFLTNREALRYWLENHRPGVILNLASALALSPSPEYFHTSAYVAAKGAILSLSRQTASAYASRGIRANVLAPGLMDTPMAARAVHNPDILRYLKSKQPLRQGPGLPSDLVGAAAFLCSDAASFITGVVLPVDGGWTVCEGSAEPGEGP